MGSHWLQTKGSAGAVAIFRVWPDWQPARIKASTGSSGNTFFLMSHILFALQGSTCGAFVCGIAIAGAEAKDLDQRQQQLHRECEQAHLMVFPVSLVRIDQMAVASETKAVTTAP
jgi:hypothetical protein